MSATAQKPITSPGFNVKFHTTSIDLRDSGLAKNSSPDPCTANMLDIDFGADRLLTWFQKRPQSFSPRTFHQQNHIRCREHGGSRISSERNHHGGVDNPCQSANSPNAQTRFHKQKISVR